MSKCPTRYAVHAARVGFVCLAALSLLPMTGAAQQPAPEVINVQVLGPQVGDRVPDFTLLDQNGERRTLESLMGPEGLMLVFVRSADWCPWCKTQLVDVQEQADQIRASGLGLAAVSYDPVSVLADFTSRRGITFPLLSDPDSATIRKFGILNTTVPQDNLRSYGIPFPGTFFLAPDAVVTSREFEAAFQIRTTAATMLLRLGENISVPADRERVAAPQMQLTLYSSDPVVAPGHRFSLVVDSVPDPNVHVYAPTVASYQPIGIRLDAQPGLVIGDATYPESELYYFEPLDETVPVFQAPFRLTQEVMVDPSPAGREALDGQTTLTIRGTLEYQACDDRICFFPQSVPVQWTVRLGELDTEPAQVP
jgi:peroxiredoxin